MTYPPAARPQLRRARDPKPGEPGKILSACLVLAFLAVVVGIGFLAFGSVSADSAPLPPTSVATEYPTPSGTAS